MLKFEPSMLYFIKYAIFHYLIETQQIFRIVLKFFF